MFDLPTKPQTVAPASHAFTVAARIDPFVAGIVRREFPAGITVAEAMAELQLDAAQVFIGGQHVPREWWGRVRPNPGVVVHLKPVPGVPGIATLVGAIAGSWATTTTAALFAEGALGTILSSAIGAVVSFGVQAAITSLFGADTGKREAQADSPARYSITGGRNTLTPFGPVPVVHGNHRMFPPYGAAPYTEVVGDDQYLRVLVIWGMGPVNVTDIRIGNTPITDFQDVEQEHNFVGGAVSSALYPNTASQEDLNIVLTTAYQERETAIDATEIGVTLTFPGGLYRVNDKGVRVNAGATVNIQYRQKGTSTWIDWIDNAFVERQENSAVRLSYRITGLAEGKYEVRAGRSLPSTDDAVQDELQWTALRSFRAENPIARTGVAWSAFRMRATGQLNGAIDQISGRVYRQAQVWNGADWLTVGYTSNPAAVYRDMLIGNANKRPTTISRLDDTQFATWYNFCTTNNLTYDAVLLSKRSLADVLKEVAAAGMASPVMNGDLYSVTIDTTRGSPVQHFTPSNIVKDTFRSEIVYGRVPHALRVTYVSAARDFRANERIVYDDGFNAANATEFDEIRVPGVTSEEGAYRFGRHFLASARLRPERWFFEVDFEHLVAQRGDLIRLSHDVAKIGQASGRIKAISGSDVTLDEFMTIEAGKAYTLRVRGQTGNTITATVSTGVGSWKTVTLSSVVGMAVGDLAMFGETGAETIEALIQGIEPLDDFQARIECIPYNAAIAGSWAVIPPYVPSISEPVALSETGPAAPRITSILSDERALPQSFEGTPQPAILVGIAAGANTGGNPFVTDPVSFRLRWKWTGSTPVTVETYDGSSGGATLTASLTPGGYEYLELPADAAHVRIPNVHVHETYEIGLQAVDASGGVSQWVEAEHRVAGFSAPPPAVDSFGLSALGDQAYVEWTYPSIVGDVVGYEIRYHASEDITDWSQMMTISTDVPRSARAFTVPNLSGSYAIKPFDVLGNRAATALFVNSSLVDPEAMNVVANLDAAAGGWSGTHTDTFVDDGDLVLGTLTTIGDWGTIGGMGTLLGPKGFRPTGSYEFGETDLGEVYTSRISSTFTLGWRSTQRTIGDWGTLGGIGTFGGTFAGDEFTAEVQIATSAVDSSTPSWGVWRKLTAGDFTARHVKFRVVLSTDNYRVSPKLTALSVTVDMPDRVARGENVASGAGAKAITFSPAFKAAPSITVAGQDMGTGDYFEITGQSRTGFTVTFKDSGGIAVNRTFDWQAVGYGRERGT